MAYIIYGPQQLRQQRTTYRGQRVGSVITETENVAFIFITDTN